MIVREPGNHENISLETLGCRFALLDDSTPMVCRFTQIYHAEISFVSEWQEALDILKLCHSGLLRGH
ncbi:hypothetical protein Tco_0085666 [Tanacetum coccineum]